MQLTKKISKMGIFFIYICGTKENNFK